MRIKFRAGGREDFHLPRHFRIRAVLHERRVEVSGIDGDEIHCRKQ